MVGKLADVLMLMIEALGVADFLGIGDRKLVGKVGVVIDDFQDGMGTIKVGATFMKALAAEDSEQPGLKNGDKVKIVECLDSRLVKVSRQAI